MCFHDIVLSSFVKYYFDVEIFENGLLLFHGYILFFSLVHSQRNKFGIVAVMDL